MQFVVCIELAANLHKLRGNREGYRFSIYILSLHIKMEMWLIQIVFS